MIAAILILIGGVTVAAGALLTWLELTVAGISFASGIFIEGGARGTELSYGIATLAGGVALVVVGFLVLAFRRGRWLSVAAVVVSLISAALALYVLITQEARFAEYAARVTETDDPGELRQRVEGFFNAGSIDVNPAVGLFVALAGSFVSLIGGVARILGRRRRPAAVVERRDTGFAAAPPAKQ